AGLLRQRQVPLGRPAVRGVQGQDRRGAEGRRRDGRQGDAQGQGLRRPHEGREDRGGGGAGGRAGAGGGEDARPGHHRLQGVGRQRPVEGLEERPAPGGHLLRLPVPVLQAGRAAAFAAGEGVRQQGPHDLEELPAAVPQQRRAGGRGGHGGGRAGEVLAD